MRVLVTGGAGYIGSHTVVALVAAGHDVVIADNFVNSKPESLRRINRLCGRELPFYECDLCDPRAAEAVFAGNRFDAVIHFAGLKAVGESVQQPLRYYENNLTNTFVLLECMLRHDVPQLVFSSSATVYGDPETLPIPEDAPTFVTNPYGATKLFIERILTDTARAHPELNIALLRYFNPIGTHPGGLIGEDPNGIPNNLVPFVAQVAVGRLQELSVFGDDYPTPDGTGVRDYVHVDDLAEGHVVALEKLCGRPGVHIYNLGTGKGSSVLEVVRAYERACGKPVPYVVKPRRAGDVAVLCADVTKAARELGWSAKKNLDEMCADSWNFQKNNPNGYTDGA